MTLNEGEYKITDGGIWIPKAVLEKWRDHYLKCAKDASQTKELCMILTGKADTCIDMLKMFET